MPFLFLYDPKVLANEVVIAGSIRPGINIWLAQKGQLLIPCVQGIISWPYRASQIFIAGPVGPAIITLLAKIVITLLKSFENPPPAAFIQADCHDNSMI